MYCDLTVELTESIEADVTVWFHCTFAGCAATYYDPPEPPEFEVDDVEIEIMGGPHWEKTRGDLEAGGWYNIALEKALEALDNYDELYEHQLDAWNNDDRCDY